MFHTYGTLYTPQKIPDVRYFSKKFMFSTNQTASNICTKTTGCTVLVLQPRHTFVLPNNNISCLNYRTYGAFTLRSTFDQWRHQNTMSCLNYRMYGTFLSKHHKPPTTFRSSDGTTYLKYRTYGICCTSTPHYRLSKLPDVWYFSEHTP